MKVVLCDAEEYDRCRNARVSVAGQRQRHNPSTIGDDIGIDACLFEIEAAMSNLNCPKSVHSRFRHTLGNLQLSSTITVHDVDYHAFSAVIKSDQANRSLDYCTHTLH